MADAPRIGIIVNPLKPGGKALLLDLLNRFGERGIPTLIEDEAAELGGLKGGLDLLEMAEKADILVVLGGDGTILYNLRRLGDNVKPLASINTGTLGFLTCATQEESGELVDALITGEYRVSERAVISATLRREGKPPETFSALNEITIDRGMNSRVVDVEACVNGQTANRYTGDGLIVATPTGSTAYSLSAGGPLVEPHAKVFVMTPICPHTVANRPLVVDGTSEISLSIPDQSDNLSLAVDGQLVAEISSHAIVEVKLADFFLPLITLPGQNFYGVLHQKLGWTGSSLR